MDSLYLLFTQAFVIGHAMKFLENSTVDSRETESRKGKWHFSIIMKIISSPKRPWKALRFLDRILKTIDERIH